MITNNRIIEAPLRIAFFFFIRIDDSTSNSPTSELNNLFNQVTMQMTNNSTNKNSTQKSDAFERESGKRKTDNESDDLSK